MHSLDCVLVAEIDKQFFIVIVVLCNFFLSIRRDPLMG